ncbi:hypothetical protein [Streptomyces sp. NPDC057302]
MRGHEKHFDEERKRSAQDGRRGSRVEVREASPSTGPGTVPSVMTDS